MKRVILRGHICVQGEQLGAVKRALEEHTRLTREEPGCIVFEVTQLTDDPLIFDVYEEFTNEAAFELHQISVAASAWSEVTKDVGLSRAKAWHAPETRMADFGLRHRPGCLDRCLDSSSGPVWSPCIDRCRAVSGALSEAKGR